MAEVITERIGHYRVSTTKTAIHAEACAAALAGTPIDDACRYPFGTQSATHFVAIYLLTAAPAQPTTPDTTDTL